MTTRTQYLIFLAIWVLACFAGVVICEAFGFSFDTDALIIRITLILISIVALVPAAGGYALIQRCGSVVDKWRIRRGRDIDEERKYEDEDGVIHLFEVPGCKREHEIGVSEMVREMRPVIEGSLSGTDED